MKKQLNRFNWNVHVEISRWYPKGHRGRVLGSFRANLFELRSQLESAPKTLHVRERDLKKFASAVGAETRPVVQTDDEFTWWRVAIGRKVGKYYRTIVFRRCILSVRCDLDYVVGKHTRVYPVVVHQVNDLTVKHDRRGRGQIGWIIDRDLTT